MKLPGSKLPQDDLGTQQVHLAFCSHPVSLPGSPPGLAQCWESGLGKCCHYGGGNTQEACLGVCARSFTAGGQRLCLLHRLWRIKDPSPTGPKGWRPGLPTLGAVLVPSLSPNPPTPQALPLTHSPPAYPPTRVWDNLITWIYTLDVSKH